MRQRGDVNGSSSLKRVACSLVLGMPLGVMAQYKVIGPGGAITYTDRPPVSAPGRIEAMGEPTTVSQLSTTATLPLDLRQAVGRYPVTLYGQKNCDGCDAGRQYLRQRGIPFTEKLVNDGDGEALERATGSRQLPALTIGNQVLRGYSATQWASYLDAAGYPKQSRLPATYSAPAPTPLVPDVPPTPAVPTPAAPPPAVAAPPAPGGIRF